MKLTQIGRTRGDETAPFSVTDYKAKTVVEFINEVLEERPHEWGYIGIRSREFGSVFGSPHVEYRDGELLQDIPDKMQYVEIDSIESSGGWSRMDYLITPKRL